MVILVLTVYNNTYASSCICRFSSWQWWTGKYPSITPTNEGHRGQKLSATSLTSSDKQFDCSFLKIKIKKAVHQLHTGVTPLYFGHVT